VRFAVGSPNGARAGVWRVWLNERRDDVYISARTLVSALKVSLHPDYWYIGFTKQYAERDASLLPPGADRKTATWERPEEFAPGWTRAFEIIVPASEVVQPPTPYDDPDAVVWLAPPNEGESTRINILLSKPDAARGRRGYPSHENHADTTTLITKLDLSTDETLWVIAHVEPTTPDEAREIEKARKLAEAFREDFGRRRADDPGFEPRAFLFGDDSSGARTFLDVSLVPRPTLGKDSS
jgi:hypothetical protein